MASRTTAGAPLPIAPTRDEPAAGAPWGVTPRADAASCGVAWKSGREAATYRRPYPPRAAVSSHTGYRAEGFAPPNTGRSFTLPLCHSNRRDTRPTHTPSLTCYSARERIGAYTPVALEPLSGAQPRERPSHGACLARFEGNIDGPKPAVIHARHDVCVCALRRCV